MKEIGNRCGKSVECGLVRSCSAKFASLLLVNECCHLILAKIFDERHVFIVIGQHGNFAHCGRTWSLSRISLIPIFSPDASSAPIYTFWTWRGQKPGVLLCSKFVCERSGFGSDKLNYRRISIGWSFRKFASHALEKMVDRVEWRETLTKFAFHVTFNNPVH